MMRVVGLFFGIVMLAVPVKAAEFMPIKPLDVKDIDPAMLKDIYGSWEIRDRTGKKRCRVTLKPGQTIGGSEITVAPGCAKTFPVMGDITAWRLMENWTIDFADALRKTRLRFQTPDDRYVAIPEIDGIDTIVKK